MAQDMVANTPPQSIAARPGEAGTQTIVIFSDASAAELAPAVQTLQEALVRTYRRSPALMVQQAAVRGLDSGAALERSQARPQLSTGAGSRSQGTRGTSLSSIPAMPPPASGRMAWRKPFSHDGIQASHLGGARWDNVKSRDRAFVTDYAITEDQEDFAKSALFAYALIHHPDRFPPGERKRIEQQIPVRCKTARTKAACKSLLRNTLSSSRKTTDCTAPNHSWRG
ncbi:hypothetical protein PK98_00255 [Croceibacterium mercuriale]|uniref:Uncharacterized protein n=2 Tax=Croceibacterium mercuriale TaxID=1572751 RepID=A0A0B2BV17_9SPHN|nr:hypothetical protein PK98_00255 [Croceibacterium mercuriale]